MERKPLKKRGVSLALVGLLIILIVIVAVFANREFKKLTYKLSYPGEINACAQKYEVDPYLVAAVVHAESGNRKDVSSPKGAVGLMQIMPDTGEWIAQKLEIHYDEDIVAILKNPAINIEFGCWYLNYLSERFETDELVLCAYNAGPSNVRKWLGDESLSEDGRLTRIPFPETEKYVQRVEGARKVYKELYPRGFKEKE